MHSLLDRVLCPCLDDIHRLWGSNPLKLNTRLPLHQWDPVLLLRLVKQDTDTSTTRSTSSTTAMDIRLHILQSREYEVMQEMIISNGYYVYTVFY